MTPIASTGDPGRRRCRLFADFTGDFETAYLIAAGRIGAALTGTARPNAGARGGEVWVCR